MIMKQETQTWGDVIWIKEFKRWCGPSIQTILNDSKTFKTPTAKNTLNPSLYLIKALTLSVVFYVIYGEQKWKVVELTTIHTLGKC